MRRHVCVFFVFSFHLVLISALPAILHHIETAVCVFFCFFLTLSNEDWLSVVVVVVASGVVELAVDKSPTNRAAIGPDGVGGLNRSSIESGKLFEFSARNDVC